MRSVIYAATLLGVCFLMNCLFLWDKDHLHGLRDDSTVLKKMLNRAYLAAATVSTVGFGDIHPISSTARLVVGAQMTLILLGGIAAARALMKRRR